jgi:hypothetical protein
MGQTSTRKTSVSPLDFSSFLQSHNRSEAHKLKKAETTINRFGNYRRKRRVSDQGTLNLAKAQLEHGVQSKYIRNRYSDNNTPEGKALLAVMKAIEKDIGKPFDARQSMLMTLIRSKVVIIMQVGKYLESKEEIVDYEQGTVPHVVDKTFFTASASLRSALNELYTGRNAKQRGQKTYDDIVEEMKKDK